MQRQIDRVIAAGNAGRFKIGEKSLAELREDTKEPIPEPVLAKLTEFHDHEFLTRELCENAVADALISAGITDRAERGRLQKHILSHAENRKVVEKLFSIFRANTPQLYVDLNRDQCQTMGVNPNDVFNTLQIYLGSLYVNDFNRFGRTWQVVVQADGRFPRRSGEDQAAQGAQRHGATWCRWAPSLERQGDRRADQHRPLQHVSRRRHPRRHQAGHLDRARASTRWKRLCNEILPPGMAFEWTEINYMQIDAAKNIWNN